ncbi:hypothetical protein OAO87_03615 [bacterium]|nr:hypothetical protein [bacterium]
MHCRIAVPPAVAAMQLSLSSKQMQAAVRDWLTTCKCVVLPDFSLNAARRVSRFIARGPVLNYVCIGDVRINLESLRGCQFGRQHKPRGYDFESYQLDLFNMIVPALEPGHEGESSDGDSSDGEGSVADPESRCTVDQWAAACALAVPIIVALQVSQVDAATKGVDLTVGQFKITMPSDIGVLKVRCFDSYAYPEVTELREHALALLAAIVHARSAVIRDFDIAKQGEDDRELARLLNMLTVGVPSLTSLDYSTFNMAGPMSQQAMVHLISSGCVPSLAVLTVGGDGAPMDRDSIDDAWPVLFAALRASGAPAVQRLHGEAISFGPIANEFHRWPTGLKHVLFTYGEWHDRCETDVQALAERVCAMPSSCALETFCFHQTHWRVEELLPSSTVKEIRFDDGKHNNEGGEYPYDVELDFLFAVFHAGGAPSLTSLDFAYTEFDVTLLTEHIASDQFPSRIVSINLLPNMHDGTDYDGTEKPSDADVMKLLQAARSRDIPSSNSLARSYATFRCGRSCAI